jgi:GNAT superfamily N-acetyltransferase
METTIRRLAVDEVPALASFAEACFREAFRAQLEPASLEALCAAAFALPLMKTMILDGVWVAGDWQGYIALGEVPCPIPGLAEPTIELARLYVPRCWQGQGIADRLMEGFLGEAAVRHARSVWLQAYANSPRALAFYRRWGFVDHGAHTLTCEGVSLPHRWLGRNL